ncbi:hypothetical protein [Kribbella turkmenica]|uniref:hypothetical protein n=1 Tax=Kribbella turkmenica TaxID=2530375 RepID=UPI001F18B449|nr:hypothetical protein [Kribbella turkmenica]
MRRVLAVGLAVLLGATVLTACQSDPVPTDVAVAWAGDGGGGVEVTWKDDNAPNRITIEGVLSSSPSYVKYLGAGEPNTWEIPTSAFPPDGNYRVAVATGTSQGGVTSKLAHSEVFDTDGPVRPSGASPTPMGRGVLMKWSVPAAPPDFTPNDPLDVKGPKTQRYVPMVGRPGGTMRAIGPATTSTRQLIKSLQPPYLFQLRAQNEWSSRIGGEVVGLTSSVNGALPALALYGVQVHVRGRVLVQEVVCEAETACVQRRATPAGVPVVILTQVTPGARWTPVARGSTTAGGHYDIPMVNGPSRPYRAVVPAYTRVGVLTGTSTSRPTYTKSVVRVAGAGFAGGASKRRGENVVVSTTVTPAMNTTVVLQLWNRQTRRWVNQAAVPMRKGLASLPFKASRAGSFSYRFVIPNAMMFGRPLAGTTTPPLPLSVR